MTDDSMQTHEPLKKETPAPVVSACRIIRSKVQYIKKMDRFTQHTYIIHTMHAFINLYLQM